MNTLYGMQFRRFTAVIVLASASLHAQTRSITAPGPSGAFPVVAPQPAVQTSPILGPKQPGKIRIGIASPKVQMGQGASVGDISTPFRTMIAQYFSGPNIEIATLAAVLPMQVDAEAREKQCDYVFYSSLTQKKGSGLGLLKAASTLSSLTPIGMMAGAANAARMAGVAASTAAATSAASVASTVHAKSEVTLDYSLSVPGNPTPALASTLSAKAKQDGEDIISPLLTQAATAVLTQIVSKKQKSGSVCE